MKIITAAEMTRIDKTSGVEPAVLMERAGKALACFIQSSLPKFPVFFICGSGNNGADGFVAARYLHSWGREVEVWLAGEKSRLGGLPRIQAHKLDIEIAEIARPENLSHVFTRPGIAVDCLFGTGFRAPLDKYTKEVIDIINKKSKITIACDIPSGVSGDTGEADESAAVADVTVTFEFPKAGHVLGRGSLLAGSLEVAGIGTGLSPEYYDDAELTARADIAGYFERRPRNSHKKTFGHVLIVGGSPGMSGAVALAALGALRSGAGLVTSAVGSSISGAVSSMSMSSMELLLEESPGGFLLSNNSGRILEYIERRRIDCLVLGPGMTAEREPEALTCELVAKAPCPIVLDADGLNNIAGHLEILRGRTHPTVLTPHPGEMAKLLGVDAERVQEDRRGAVSRLAQETQGVVLLKGYRSLVAADGKIYINPTGGPALAAGGSGDILSGICGTLIAQKWFPAEAARAAAWVHGRAGDIASWRMGERYVLPNDILGNLWRV